MTLHRCENGKSNNFKYLDLARSPFSLLQSSVSRIYSNLSYYFYQPTQVIPFLKGESPCTVHHLLMNAEKINNYIISQPKSTQRFLLEVLPIYEPNDLVEFCDNVISRIDAQASLHVGSRVLADIACECP